jgi:hypothetical protein
MSPSAESVSAPTSTTVSSSSAAEMAAARDRSPERVSAAEATRRKVCPAAERLPAAMKSGPRRRTRHPGHARTGMGSRHGVSMRRDLLVPSARRRSPFERRGGMSLPPQCHMLR